MSGLLTGETKRGDVVRDSSGFNVTVSNAGFDDFESQSLDAARFLTLNSQKVRELVSIVGPGGVVLDFGVRCRDTVTQSDVFTPELIRAAGACGVALQISRYPISDGEAAAG